MKSTSILFGVDQGGRPLYQYSVLLEVEVRYRSPMDDFNNFIKTLWTDFIVLLWSSIFIHIISNSVVGNEIFNWDPIAILFEV